MAPEVINKAKYKKAADVFSFGVTMYECFTWGEVDLKAVFRFPWQVSAFVQSGRRPKSTSFVEFLVDMVVHQHLKTPPLAFLGLS